jgi:hypothetical protein
LDDFFIEKFPFDLYLIYGTILHCEKRGNMKNLKINNNIKKILGCKKAIIVFGLVLGLNATEINVVNKNVEDNSFKFYSYEFNQPKGKMLHINKIISVDDLNNRYGPGKHLVMPLDQKLIENLFEEITKFEEDHRYYNMLTDKYNKYQIDRYGYSFNIDIFLEVAPDLEKNMNDSFYRFHFFQDQEGLKWEKLYKNIDDHNNVIQKYFDQMTNFYQMGKTPNIDVKEIHVRKFLFEYESYVKALNKNGYDINEHLINDEISFVK